MGLFDQFKPGYVVRFVCLNCKKTIPLKVPKGYALKDFVADTPACPVCGCINLEVVNKELLK